uniref:Uncharacterized protein n=1 Tax=Quercus lobata TaxID=97700 RepID=A0A7N2LRJ6_QUELO
MRNLELQPRRSVAEKHRLNALVYDALRREDEEKVIKLCEDFEEQGLHILTVHDDTVLQAATYAKKPSLVLRLLQELPDRHFDKLTRQNHPPRDRHIEPLTRELALQIATKFEQLVGERDTDGMTGLQLLSCNPGAFHREDEMSFFKKIVNSGKTYTAKTPPGDFKVTTPENSLLSKQAVTSKGILVSYTNLQLNPYPNTQLDLFCSDNLSFSMHGSQYVTNQ